MHWSSREVLSNSEFSPSRRSRRLLKIVERGIRMRRFDTTICAARLQTVAVAADQNRARYLEAGEMYEKGEHRSLSEHVEKNQTREAKHQK